jgi:hypothetical protein
MPERSGALSARIDRPGYRGVGISLSGTMSQCPQYSAGLPSCFRILSSAAWYPGTCPPHYLNKRRTCTAMNHLRPLPLPSTASMNATRQEEHARFRLSLRKRRPIQGTERDAVDFLLGRTYPGAKMRIPFLPTSSPHIPWVIAERQTQ